MTPSEKRNRRKTINKNRQQRIDKFGGKKQGVNIDFAIDNLYKITAGQELSPSEISRYTGIPVSTITSITRVALAKLKPYMVGQL